MHANSMEEMLNASGNNGGSSGEKCKAVRKLSSERLHHHRTPKSETSAGEYSHGKPSSISDNNKSRIVEQLSHRRVPEYEISVGEYSHGEPSSISDNNKNGIIEQPRRTKIAEAIIELERVMPFINMDPGSKSSSDQAVTAVPQNFGSKSISNSRHPVVDSQTPKSGDIVDLLICLAILTVCIPMMNLEKIAWSKEEWPRSLSFILCLMTSFPVAYLYTVYPLDITLKIIKLFTRISTVASIILTILTIRKKGLVTCAAYFARATWIVVYYIWHKRQLKQKNMARTNTFNVG